MERPDRLGAVIVVATTLAALSVYLLTHPAQLPAAGGNGAADSPLTAPLVDLARLLGVPRNVVSAIIGAVNVALAYMLLRRIGVARSTAAWLTVAFAFGTSHWYSAAAGDALGLAQVTGVGLILLALLVGLSGHLPIVCGLLVGAAAVTRLPMLLGLPLFVALYAARPAAGPSSGLAARLPAAAALILGVAAPIAFLGPAEIGPLDLDNVPLHAHAALLRSFELSPTAPWFMPSWTSVSVLLTTPLYLWLAGARSRAPVVAWSWAGVALIAALTVLGPAVGSPQFGYRPIVDALPLLLLLWAWVFRDGMSSAARWTAALSVAVNTYGMIAVGVLVPPFAGP